MVAVFQIVRCLEHKNNSVLVSFNFLQGMWEYWEQQKQSVDKNGNSNRYQPMIIRFFLSLASKSVSAYYELSSCNVLTTPSRRTLRDYKNALKPHPGFNPAVINDLIKTTNPLKIFKTMSCYHLVR